MLCFPAGFHLLDPTCSHCANSVEKDPEVFLISLPGTHTHVKFCSSCWNQIISDYNDYQKKSKKDKTKKEG